MCRKLAVIARMGALEFGVLIGVGRGVMLLAEGQMALLKYMDTNKASSNK